MRPSELLVRASDYLERHQVADARRSAEILLAAVLETDRAGLYVRTSDLSADEARAFGLALCQRCEGVPLQHLTGDQPFRSITLEVRPGVFIPRPETEEVVALALGALAAHASPIVVDLGTGTGAIALAIQAERPNAEVWAVDRSDDACALATENAQRLDLPVQVVQGDFFAALPDDLRGRVTLVVSNPPYVTPEEYEDLPIEVKADPVTALVGGLEVYEGIVRGAADWLMPRGSLVLEIGSTQGEAVAAMCAEAFADVEVHDDLAGRPRAVTAVRK